MELRSDNLTPDAAIPAEFAFGKPDPANHVALADNRNPHLAWSGAPDGTQSFVITCIDTDVPTRPDDVNQADREVPADLPRGEFVHWLMANIPADVNEIAAGSCSDGVTAKGKQQPAGPSGSVQGQNDYTAWFQGDADMAGNYQGYDGPCPPWNDSIVHHYHFTIYALDVARLPLEPGFTIDALRQALAPHVLGQASFTGTYSLNPAVPA